MMLIKYKSNRGRSIVRSKGIKLAKQFLGGLVCLSLLLTTAWLSPSTVMATSDIIDNLPQGSYCAGVYVASKTETKES